MKNVLHLLVTGGTGGIETLAREYCSRSSHNNYYMFLYRGGEISDDIQNLCGRATILDKKSYQFFGIYKKIEAFIRDNDISVVVSHHGVDFLWLYLYMIKKRMPEVSTIIYAHSYYADMLTEKKGLRGLFCKKAFYKSYATVDKMIAISHAVKNGLLEVGIERPDKIEVIYNGVDTRRFSYIPHHNEVPIICYVGRLEYVKGVHKLIEALAQVNDAYKCLIIGDGSQKSVLEKRANELGLSGSIEFCGKRSDINNILKKADIFVHPAIWNEGFGISLVEAMAAGLLCMAYDRGAMKEIIDDKETGFIVVPDTVDALAEKIKYVLNNMDNSEICDMKKKAVDKAAKFDISNYVRSLDELLERM